MVSWALQEFIRHCADRRAGGRGRGWGWYTAKDMQVRTRTWVRCNEALSLSMWGTCSNCWATQESLKLIQKTLDDMMQDGFPFYILNIIMLKLKTECNQLYQKLYSIKLCKGEKYSDGLNENMLTGAMPSHWNNFKKVKHSQSFWGVPGNPPWTPLSPKASSWESVVCSSTVMQTPN